VSARDVTLARIVGGALDTAAAEMSAGVTRTARSPIFNEAHDFVTGIFEYKNEQPRLIAQAPGCTLHLYAICDAVRSALAAFKFDLHPGDVILASDPYDGGTHIPDQVLIMPVFVNRKPVFFPAVRAHFADVGGPVAGGYNPRARDIWQDGVIVSPIKLYERGELRRDVYDMIVANNRTPQWIAGDLQAMHGACVTAAKRIQSLLRTYGDSVVLTAINQNIEYTERRVRAEISRWPDGSYYAETYIDHDYQGAHDIKVACTLTVEGSEIHFDFGGTSPQVDGFVNSPIANTLSFVFVAVASCFDEDIPINEGYINPVRVTAPAGSVVNPSRPKPVGNCTCICGAEIAEVAILALSQCAPERVGVNCHKLPLAYTNGRGRDGNVWVNLNFFGYTGGAGAGFGTDGWGLYPPVMTGVILPSIEMTEMQYPVKIIKHEYVADCTGPGRWRGVPGLETIMEYSDVSYTNVMLAGVHHPAQGLCGAPQGAANAVTLIPTPMQRLVITEVGYQVEMPPGGRIHFVRGGGGGWGDPYTRPPEDVLNDVQNGYVTIAGAAAEYGVVIDPHLERIDLSATELIRANHRSRAAADTIAAHRPAATAPKLDT